MAIDASTPSRDPGARRVWSPSARAASVCVALLAAGGACQIRNPATEVTLGQTVIEIGDAVNALRQESSAMQDQIDSLRTVIARQDSSIARLSARTGDGGLPP